MDIFAFIKLFGGLALFLYGIDIMGSGLEKLSGGKLERILEKLTNSPVKGILLGILVTAVTQSSSATTVMVVGFVNSGIMQLTQSIGIIMGANAGTTITSWIIGFTSIEGTSFLLRMLNPDSLAPILGVFGIILMYSGKKGKKRDIGVILIGFQILMYGMSGMSSSVKPLADVPEFANLLIMFENPFLGILAGAVLTAIIQSSTASVGMLQALSVTGVITYGSAVPIILGQNVGTCGTALISSIGASKNAKRAAFIHLYFNLIGVLLFSIVFYGFNAIIGFSFINESMNAFDIAVIHTLFNFSTTIVLLPFYKLLGKLAEKTVKDAETEQDMPILDQRFLNSPSFAIEQCKKVTKEMSTLARDTLVSAIETLTDYNEKTANKIIESEEIVDKYEDSLGTYLVKLSSNALSEKDSHEISKLLHTIGDFERIADHAVNIIKVAKEMHDKGIHFSENATAEIKVMSQAVIDILNLTLEAFLNDDSDLAMKVEPLEEVIDGLKAKLKNRHIVRLKDGRCTIELGFIFSDLINNYERVSDHCSNIAVCIIQIQKNVFDTHDYLNTIKNTGHPQFVKDYEHYKAKYSLSKQK